MNERHNAVVLKNLINLVMYMIAVAFYDVDACNTCVLKKIAIIVFTFINVRRVIQLHV